MKHSAAAIILATLLAVTAQAQQRSPGQDKTWSADEAMRAGKSGDMFSARQITDSLAKSVGSEAAGYAAVLFARATLAPSVLDAQLDYEKIIAETPPSPLVRESLLRLAQRALVASDSAKALGYLRRIARDYSDDASVAEAQYWIARVLLDWHDIADACTANQEAFAHSRAGQSPLLPEIESQRFVACAEALPLQHAVQPTIPTTRTAATKTVPVTGNTKSYAVQVAAYAKKGDADAMVARLRKRGLDAHADGTEKPFRVRIGRYSTYAEAASALRELRGKKIDGFVSETNE